MEDQPTLQVVGELKAVCNHCNRISTLLIVVDTCNTENTPNKRFMCTICRTMSDYNPVHQPQVRGEVFYD